MVGYTKINKASFYVNGGFSNPSLIRVTRSGSWAYFQKAG